MDALTNIHTSVRIDPPFPRRRPQVDIKHCHYLVDLDTETEAPREPRYAANKEEWSVVAYKPFLDAARSVAAQDGALPSSRAPAKPTQMRLSCLFFTPISFQFGMVNCALAHH